MLLVGALTIGVAALAAPLWFVLGRPRRSRRRADRMHLLVRYSMTRPKVSRGWPEAPRPVIGPDDDPDFLARIRVPSPEETELLSWWEADLRTGGDEWPREDKN
jgi:hypothetical protein